MRMPTLLLPEITFRAPAGVPPTVVPEHAIQVDAVAGVPEIERAAGVEADQVPLDDGAVRAGLNVDAVAVVAGNDVALTGVRCRRSCCTPALLLMRDPGPVEDAAPLPAAFRPM